ncbi:MAG: alpha-D-ribose 1-methylphosphonate 5-triphosphate diphosphatase [Minwuiales bacterium]|nr:alpha-D-ribose 1-methylphosphonate 5-triphosphate diphosphatase [Minwuiales bacterium]
MEIQVDNLKTVASSDAVLTNARIVAADSVFSGSLAISGGRIAAVDEGRSQIPGAIDCDGDYLLPGLVELHTDNLERHFSPRPGVVWPSMSAVVAHDAEIAVSGITTVFDALRLGSIRGDNAIVRHVQTVADSVAQAQQRDSLRAEHYLHMRCEVSCADAAAGLVEFVENPLVRLVSVMDHTPGQRQFANMEKYREYYGGKYGLTGDDMARFIDEAMAAQVQNSAPNRRAIVALCHSHNVALASHDDATAPHVEEAIADGMAIAEFPTTVEAAELSSKNELKVLMGGPNVVRGESHSGNVSALELAERGLLDIVSSDYVPSSLLHAAFKVADEVDRIDLPAAVGMVSRAPAEAAGLNDRGEIAPGKRADLVRVKRVDDAEIVRTVWRAGTRVV